MTQSISPLSSDDIRQALDRAIDSERGIKLTFSDHKSAVLFRSRCNGFREKDRKTNRETYSEGDPLHGNSVYDRLVLMISKEEPNVLVIQKLTLDNIKIEDL